MLVKRIDLGSIPVGLYVAGEDLIKGTAVVLKNGKLYNPTTKAEAESVMGFVTLRIDTNAGGDVADHDVIKADKKCTVYSLVKANMWGTTALVSGIAEGDDVSVSYKAGEKGKLVKSGSTAGTNDAKALFTADCVGKAGSYDLVDVIVK